MLENVLTAAELAKRNEINKEVKSLQIKSENMAEWFKALVC